MISDLYDQKKDLEVKIKSERNSNTTGRNKTLIERYNDVKR